MTWSNKTSSRTWCDEALRVDLAEIMDDLDPGWSSWREPALASEAG